MKIYFQANFIYVERFAKLVSECMLRKQRRQVARMIEQESDSDAVLNEKAEGNISERETEKIKVHRNVFINLYFMRVFFN